MHTNEYYTSEEALLSRFENLGNQMAHRAATLPQHLCWQAELRARLRGCLGLNSMQGCALTPKVLEETRMDGYLRRKIIIQTQPAVWMPFYMLVPEDLAPGQKRAALLAPHGHASCGKAETAGRVDIPGIPEAIAEFNGDYGVQLVRRGYVVFCPDARGFGERRERNFWSDDPEVYMDRGCLTCTQLNRLAIALGQSLLGMWVWDLMRLLDYAETCPECNGERIGSVGLSGGGLQTLWLAALDERVKAAVVSGYFYGFKEALLESVQCSCNYVPGVLTLVDVSDLGALVAPRPLMIETGNADPLNGKSGLGNVVPYVEKVRQAYALYEQENALAHDIFPGEHRWNGVCSIPWLEGLLPPLG